jgi:hypothetical protein
MKKHNLLVFCLFIFVSFMSFASADWLDNLNDGLLAYYKFDEETGSILPEVVFGGPDGTLFNMEDEDWVSGLINNALDFDGSNEYVQTPSDDRFDLSQTNAGTLSIWINVSSPQSHNNGYITHGNNRFYIRHLFGSLTAAFYNGEAHYAVSGIDPEIGNWYHVVATFDSSSLKVYVNGIEESTVSGIGDINYGGNEFGLTFGASHAGEAGFSDKILDEAGFWNRALTPEEVSQLYNGGIGIQCCTRDDNPPIIEPIEDITVNESETIIVEIIASDNETENLTYDIIPNGFFTQEDNVFTWVTDFEDSGVYDFVAEVSDGFNTATTDFTITINNVNRPPILDPIGNKTGFEGELLSFLINFSDPDNENGVDNDDNILTLTGVDMPEGAELIDNLFSWTPNHWQSGFYYPTFVLSDGEFDVNETITIEVIQVDATDLEIFGEDITFSDNDPIKTQIVTITAVFSNILEINPETIEVGFYDGHPDEGDLIEMVTIDTGEGPPGFDDSYFAQASWEAEVGEHDIYVFLDPNNLIEEGSEDNNIAFNSITVRDAPDLMIREQDIGFSNPEPEEGEEIDILAMVHNTDTGIAENFNVLIYMDDTSNVISLETMSLGSDNTKLLIVPWVAVGGNHTISVSLDPENIIEETNEENNLAGKDISVIELNQCVGDINNNGVVDVADFLILLGAWGPNPGHPADLDGDGIVGVTDMLLLLGNWGVCK